MRVGDFAVDVVAMHDGRALELDTGHVIAKPGTVYGLRLRNHGPLRCLAEITIDGNSVTAGGLILEAYDVVVLERPIDANEAGRFTVVAEGDERVFGPDGGRDNPDLGVIEVRFRRELPSARAHDRPRALPELPALPTPVISPMPSRPMAPPDWNPPGFFATAARSYPAPMPPTFDPEPLDSMIERAAGTGLTGQSAQRFSIGTIGQLESEATVIRLRLVIGTEDAFEAPRPLPAAEQAPSRPAARP